MTTMAHLILFVLALPATAVSLYLLLFTLLSRAPPAALRSSRRLRFDIVIPAHNEATVIESVIASLRQLDWPADNFRVLVVADNCTDSTATLARAAGAEVLERHDTKHRGKGHALDFAFQASQAHGWAYAVVVVDADTKVSPNLLEVFAARIENGAKAIQAHYEVLNAQVSWRTRLMTIALASFHRVRSRARERLQLSCGIRGNGWCITHRLLRQVPYRAYSLAEDIEYGIELGLAGFRVHYADEAHVAAMMVSGEQAASTQRQRWEDGRWQLIRSKTLPLLRAAMGSGGGVCLDLALDLLVLPLSYVAVNVALLTVLAGVALLWEPSMEIWLWLGIGGGMSLLLYVLRGWQLSGVGLRGLVDLLHAPFFVLWKVLLMLRARRSAEWVRTKREPS
ncbi:MAG: glycosyltransferase family 2 protein [Sulfuricaulis sp.]|uniref:glycosyltransferase family 2 protein n=1 Tax=Sulfuricaulis sp. TaxID=2003553 RepID=UPI0025EE8D69|nr:glycosyltransferase family 2 protein [Sulfuricaulis sp.]MCR4348076.1 glycosyltransferase family 2 protein [Sulfuricaulis sp.]